MGYRKYSTKGKGKIKVKPTIYLTQEQKELIDKWRTRSIHFGDKSICEYDYEIYSLAEFVEEAINKHIADLEERTEKIQSRKEGILMIEKMWEKFLEELKKNPTLEKGIGSEK